MRELRVEDALLYLDQVKVEFGDRPHIYNEFLDIMKTFKTQQIDTPGVIRRVSNLFQGNKKLVLGFNTFLPEGYKIELPLDGNGPPVAVFRAPGETVTHILTGPGAPPVPAPAGAAPEGQKLPATASGLPAASALAGQPVQPPSNAAVALGAQGLAERSVLGHQQASLSIPGAGVGGFTHQPQSAMHLQQSPAEQQLRFAAADAELRLRAQRQQAHERDAAISLGQPQMGARAGLTGLGQLQASPDANLGANQAVAQQQQARAMPGNAVQAEPQAAQQPQQQQPGMEFDHAINYVTTIKKRFSNEPETYKKFLEILHTYQKEQRGIKEVLEEVSDLFSEHPDLLKEFTYFLPDAVQAEAKVQLDQAAKEAEARKRAASSKQAIMQQAQGMQRHLPTGMAAMGSPQQEVLHAPVRATNPIPFGATMGRSRERESEIYRSVVYGNISFAPVRPPRKKTPTAAQSAAKNGRPTMLPPLPRQPSTSETVFFEKAKRHLNRKELMPDKPSATRVRHTPYMEFLKCLHLFGAGVLNKDELILLLRGLFMQGHAPKSGVNMGGGAGNPAIANDAQELLKEFEEILVGRGPYADQESHMKDKSKYGSKRSRDFDFRDVDRPTPSYAPIPRDYPSALFMSHHGQSEEEAKVLNDTLVCVGNKMPGTESPEDFDAINIRRNAYEEAMFRIEDERFEVDMAIERNALAMRQIEPIAEEIAVLRDTEEKDGQPIGRLQYKLKSRSLNSIQINAIGRIYGEKGDEVIEHLSRNPLAAVPIVYQRLREKDQEWRRQKSDLMAKWKSLVESNYEGSSDFLCYQNRKDVEKALTNDRLLEECKKARSFCSSLEKRFGSSVKYGLSSPDRSAVLYEPYAMVEMKPDSSAHQHAVSLLCKQVVNSSLKVLGDREKVGRIWSEFVMPFFNYPAHWLADEVRQSFRGDESSNVVRFATGQHIRTAFGEGVILAYLTDSPESVGRYRVKFPFGIGYVQASAIMHAIPNNDGTKYIRRDGVMEKDTEVDSDDSSTVVVDKKFKVLFGSEKIYLFMRLYSSLVSLLEEIESFIRANPAMDDPSSKYYNPMKSANDTNATNLDFPTVILNLKKVIGGKMSTKDFEAFCRRVSPDLVHKMAALPKLVERGGLMLVHTAEEDLLLQLFDHCQYVGANPVQLRDRCLAIAPDAAFRIQYNTTNGRLYFSYLPEGELLPTVVGGDDDDDDDDAMDGGIESDDDDDDDDDDVMDVEDEEEDLRQVKRVKLI